MINIITTLFELSDIKKLATERAGSIVMGDRAHATASTGCFTLDDIKEARRTTAATGQQLYVRCDRFYFENDLAPLKDYLVKLKEIGVDGIYFSDMAVLMLARELDLEDKLIHDPETTMTNNEDVALYLGLGIGRVVLSKELTLDEMLKIARKHPGKTEIVIHGHLRMSRSKRLILSGYQKEYATVDLHENWNLTVREENREAPFPIYEDDWGTYTFSPYTLCSLAEIREIAKAISHVRMDGAFKDIDYLCDALGAYRAVLNGQRDGHEALEVFREMHPLESLSTGFMYEKTNI